MNRKSSEYQKSPRGKRALSAFRRRKTVAKNLIRALQSLNQPEGEKPVINSLKSTPTDAIMRELDNIEANNISMIVRAAELLCELRDRNTHHPAMRTAILKWFAEIHSGKLHPEFVVMFASDTPSVKAAVGTPLEDQAAWARGGKIRLAEVNSAYEVIEREKPLVEFSPKDRRTVFGPTGMRSIEQQKTILRREVADVAPVAKPEVQRVRANITEGVLLIQKPGKIRIGELKEPLEDLGFRLVRIKAAKKKSKKEAETAE